jgi:hypothetical protein
MTRSQNLYAYCLFDCGAAGIEPAGGVTGARVRVIPYGDIAAVVSPFDDDHIPPTPGNVLAHEKVVESILAKTTPLPFRFGTLTSTTRLESYIESNRPSLVAALARVRGLVEMSVKIIERSKPALAVVEQGESPRYASGAAFLAAKQREMFERERSKERAAEIAGWLEGQLSDLARASLVSERPAERLVLSAAHLIEREEVEIYRERVRSAFQGRRELHFLTSGPWPPYSFCGLDNRDAD